MPRLDRSINLRLILLFFFPWVLAFGKGSWTLPESFRQLPIKTSTQEFHYEPPFHYSCEVVGAGGRVGSFWLCHADAAVPVPRGVSPGCWTTVGCPIYVATPSAAWPQIWHQTLVNRRHDLVFVGNGIPPPEWESATVVVPHFAILTKCQVQQTCISIHPRSPPTYLYGRHAPEAARILQTQGIPTKILKTFQDIQQMAALKLMWASCMWLLCHSTDSTLTVSQVHNEKQEELDKLVDEIYPALDDLLGRPVNRRELDQYLRDYSFSIGDAVPSRELAMTELQDRNGVWLARRSEIHLQTYHQWLIQKVAGTDVWNRVLSQIHPSATSNRSSPQKEQICLDSIGLVCWGEKSVFRPATTSVMIIGGGIIGTSLALFLAERRPDLNITIVDQLPTESLGRTTPASWAWLNANAKSPKSYQILNQLGMHVWKQEPHLRGLVSWMGSLVRFAEPPQFVKDGGYPAEGPLSDNRILELEPLANWKLEDNGSNNDGYTYYFRDEGCVDPVMAVNTLRKAAADKGVQYLGHANVTSVIRDPSSGNVCGVRVLLTEEKKKNIFADVVAVAAGAGSGAKGLGCGFRLLHRPGTIAYATPNEKVHGRLSRILVDPFRSSHILQRPDGSIVAGGGALEVGGTVGTVTTPSQSNIPNQSLLDGAKSLSPSVVEGCVVSHTCEAVRPMPTDGLPIIGFVEKGLYSAVTHSGMTLGPLLSSLAAAEIAEGVSCDLLDPFRPSRF